MKKGFKYQIEQALKKQNWEISQIDTSEQWWDNEHWKICSKHNHNFYFFLCFIVDPMFEKHQKQRQEIYEIKAISQFPENWNDETHTIASFPLSKGNFGLNLEMLINKIKLFSENKKSDNE